MSLFEKNCEGVGGEVGGWVRWLAFIDLSFLLVNLSVANRLFVTWPYRPLCQLN